MKKRNYGTKEMTYKKLGVIDKNYKYEPEWIVPYGLLEDPSLILKLYAMFKNKIDREVFSEAQKFLLDRIHHKEIDPLIGLGFAILSNEMLNVARWDKEDPIVPKNQIYSYEQSHKDNKYFSEAQLLDIRDLGSYCTEELNVVNHEKNAWLRYVNSERRKTDKKEYLDSWIRVTPHYNPEKKLWETETHIYERLHSRILTLSTTPSPSLSISSTIPTHLKV